MLWSDIKRMIDEHIHDDQDVDLIAITASLISTLDFDWNEDGTVTIFTDS